MEVEGEKLWEWRGGRGRGWPEKMRTAFRGSESGLSQGHSTHSFSSILILLCT